MKHYDTVLFDLDGTLIDSSQGIVNSFIYALEKYGAPIKERNFYLRFIGPPLLTSFASLGYNNEESEKLISLYREYYVERGMMEITLYPGMAELLQRLKSHGKRLAIATSKPERFAIPIIDSLNLSDCFDFIGGAYSDAYRSEKEEVIEYTLQSLSISDHSSVVMVGDKSFDIFGAKQNGIDSIGVLFGFGTREELSAAGATFIAETVDEIEYFVG